MKVRYICKYCGWATSIDSFWRWFWTPHLGAKKYLKCRHCYDKRHFMKRWDERKWIDWPKERDYDKAN